MSFYDFKKDVPYVLPKTVLETLFAFRDENIMRCDDNYIVMKIKDEENETARFYIFSYPKNDDKYNEIRRKELLGRGTSGSVVKGWQIKAEKGVGVTFSPVAVKIVDVNEKISQQLEEQSDGKMVMNVSSLEKNILEQLKLEEKINREFHPLETEDLIHEKYTNEIFLITKRLPQEPLMHNLRISPAVAELSLLKKLDFILDILDNVKTLHSLGVSHGDLTANNILVGEDPIKPFLTDFGNVRTKSSTLLTSPGTVGHLAPEILKNSFSETTDIFSIAPDFMAILGAENVYQHKIAAREKITDMDEKNKAEVKAQYNMKGIEKIFQTIPVDSKARELFQNMVTNFLNTMVNGNPKLRPSVDDAIIFFKTTRNVLEKLMVMKSKKTSRLRFFSKQKSDTEKLVGLFDEEEKQVAGLYRSGMSKK